MGMGVGVGGWGCWGGGGGVGVWWWGCGGGGVGSGGVRVGVWGWGSLEQTMWQHSSRKHHIGQTRSDFLPAAVGNFTRTTCDFYPQSSWRVVRGKSIVIVVPAQVHLGHTHIKPVPAHGNGWLRDLLSAATSLGPGEFSRSWGILQDLLTAPVPRDSVVLGGYSAGPQDSQRV